MVGIPPQEPYWKHDGRKMGGIDSALEESAQYLLLWSTMLIPRTIFPKVLFSHKKSSIWKDICNGLRQLAECRVQELEGMFHG